MISASLQYLGLTESSTLSDLKTKYKQLALAHHPDAGGDTEVFACIIQAHREVLEWMQNLPCPSCTNGQRTRLGPDLKPRIDICPICNGSGKRA